MTADPLDGLRRVCTALPEVTERFSHGEPTLVRGRQDVRDLRRPSPRRPAGILVCRSNGSPGGADGSSPELFFRPPYVGHRSWLGVYLDVPVDWDEVGAIVTDAYRVVAPGRALVRLA